MLLRGFPFVSFVIFVAKDSVALRRRQPVIVKHAESHQAHSEKRRSWATKITEITKKRTRSGNASPWLPLRELRDLRGQRFRCSSSPPAGHRCTWREPPRTRREAEILGHEDHGDH